MTSLWEKTSVDLDRASDRAGAEIAEIWRGGRASLGATVGNVSQAEVDSDVSAVAKQSAERAVAEGKELCDNGTRESEHNIRQLQNAARSKFAQAATALEDLVDSAIKAVNSTAEEAIRGISEEGEKLSGGSRQGGDGARSGEEEEEEAPTGKEQNRLLFFQRPTARTSVDRSAGDSGWDADYVGDPETPLWRLGVFYAALVGATIFAISFLYECVREFRQQKSKNFAETESSACNYHSLD